jgi:hypothetical protein
MKINEIAPAVLCFLAAALTVLLAVARANDSDIARNGYVQIALSAFLFITLVWSGARLLTITDSKGDVGR